MDAYSRSGPGDALHGHRERRCPRLRKPCSRLYDVIWSSLVKECTSWHWAIGL